jgi:hypothetical protein
MIFQRYLYAMKNLEKVQEYKQDGERLWISS